MLLPQKNYIGNRICIIGPSGAGKSTLAHKIGQKQSLPVLHLDKIAHIPHTKWVRCSMDDFKEKHDEFISQDKWIVEGNYRTLIPFRLERADTVIYLRFNRFGCLYRFIRRALKKDKNRYGKLEGAIDYISLNILIYILFKAPKRNRKYLELFHHYPHIKVIQIQSFKKMDELLDEI